MHHQQRWIKKMAWPLGVLLLLATIFFSPSVPAFASSRPQTATHPKPLTMQASAQRLLAVTYSGNTCNWRDPYQTGCAQSGSPVASNSSGALLVELEWSPICHTNWTQAYWFGSNQPSLVLTIQRLAGQDGGYLFDNYWGNGNSFWWNTNQFYAPHNKAIACVYYATQSAQDPGLCTKPT